MKKFKFMTLAVCVVLTCVTLSSCSSDDDEPSSDVIGKWICIESSYDSRDYDYYITAFEVEDGIIFFNGNFESDDKLIKGKKCFILDNGTAYIEDEGNKSNPTELDWNKNVIDYGPGDQEYSEIYRLNGSSLSIFECDLDRLVGSISIDGDIMTYTYKFQNWNSSSQLLTYESETFVSKFQKQ